MLRYLEYVPDVNPIVVDNNSTYLPLLEWYEQNSVEVVRLQDNLGCKSPWQYSIVPSPQACAKQGISYYVVTDVDLDLSGCPFDLINQLKRGFELSNESINIVKSGLSLKIDDIPNANPYKLKILEWETKYWLWSFRVLPDLGAVVQQNFSPIDAKLELIPNLAARQWNNTFFLAPIDTTFALYQANVQHETFINFGRDPRHACVRLSPPYTAKHVPWYWIPNKLDEETQYIIKHTKDGLTHWTEKMRHFGG